MNLNTTQLQTLKAAIAANADPAFVLLRNGGATSAMADWYNGASTFTAWKSAVPIAAVGIAFNSSELAGLTTANTNRLIVMANYSGGTFDPSKTDVRAGVDSVFSGAGGAQTRAALLALWKRVARLGEALFAAGTGTDAVPGTFTAEGLMTDANIVQALAA